MCCIDFHPRLGAGREKYGASTGGTTSHCILRMGSTSLLRSPRIPNVPTGETNSGEQAGGDSSEDSNAESTSDIPGAQTYLVFRLHIVVEVWAWVHVCLFASGEVVAEDSPHLPSGRRLRYPRGIIRGPPAASGRRHPC